MRHVFHRKQNNISCSSSAQIGGSLTNCSRDMPVATLSQSCVTSSVSAIVGSATATCWTWWNFVVRTAGSEGKNTYKKKILKPEDDPIHDSSDCEIRFLIYSTDSFPRMDCSSSVFPNRALGETEAWVAFPCCASVRKQRVPVVSLWNAPSELGYQVESSSWWFQPISKILVKLMSNWIISPGRGENEKIFKTTT